MYLFGSLWQKWQLPFKLVTPVLHLAFSFCQLHGSRVFYKLWRKQVALLEKEEEEMKLEQGRAVVVEEAPKQNE